jgi:hypothetical protein
LEVPVDVARVTKGVSVLLMAVALCATAPAALGRPPAPTGPSSTPQLIERAASAGKLDRATANLYLAYALTRPARLPSAYRGAAPWDGTLVARRLRRSLRRMRPSARRDEIAAILGSGRSRARGPGAGVCDFSATPTTDSLESEHFYVEYNDALIGGGLTIGDYVESLEEAWQTEVDAFDWAAPPMLPDQQPPGGKYHVRVTALPAGLYGFVSNLGTYAGTVGDNPNTGWDDRDADASCMVLNQDFETGFGGDPQAALDSTTAHEFNHSLQFGYGALSGGNVPDDSFIEGGATWMEDEVQDGANDNYNYLWPEFAFSMGEYSDATTEPYPYWITFRGLTERYGAGQPGGAEEVMQDFWELISRGDTDTAPTEMLDALGQALATKGTTLAGAYHAYAIAVKYNRGCGGGYAQPYCLEEGPAYVSAAGPTEVHGSIAAPGGSLSGTIEDNYALNWIALPAAGGAYDVTLANKDAAGTLRATVACDTGSGLALAALPAVATAGASSTLTAFNPSSCTSPIAVVTNQAQTGGNPSGFTERAYTLSTKPSSAPGRAVGGGTSGGETAGGTPGGGGNEAQSGGGTTTTETGATDTTAPALRLRVRSRASLSRLLRRGLRIRLRVGEPSVVRVRLVLSRRVARRLGIASRAVAVGRGKKRARRAGTLHVRVRLTRAGKKALRRKRSVLTTLRLSATDARGNSSRARKRIRFRRARR